MMKDKGFTLLEVLVTTLIFAFMGTGVVFFISNSNNVMRSGVRQANIHTNASRILNMIARDIKEGAIVKNVTDSLSCVITKPDSTEITWSYQTVDNTRRILRNGVQVPFFGDMGVTNTANYVYMSFTPSLEGKYFKTNLVFRVRMDNEYVNLNTVAYCRHTPYGYFDPQDFITAK